jgi:hypothetical protein
MMTLEEWEKLRKEMETEAEQDGQKEDSAEPAYVSEEHKEHDSVDNEDD